jgi:hypothetical protein
MYFLSSKEDKELLILIYEGFFLSNFSYIFYFLELNKLQQKIKF